MGASDLDCEDGLWTSGGAGGVDFITTCTQGNGGLVFKSHVGANESDWGAVVERERVELSRVEADLAEFAELLAKLEGELRDSGLVHRQRELVEMYVGCSENGEDGLDVEKELQTLLQEHRRFVRAMYKTLMEQGAREQLLQVRLDGVGRGLACAAKTCAAVDGTEEQERRRKVVEELNGKHRHLSDVLSAAGNDLRKLHVLQQRREECVLRLLQEHAPLLAARCAENASFLSETLETGIFSMAGGVLLGAVFGTLMYKRYSLI
ncbi:uncharacterized protein Tco025E_04054 [Trypanosoma conorhini]|uniref:Uncharacterized protein n=1 Tax=Trypanosoma conorhini TaxID=83891 RepID=A0A3R7LSN4_9TRYP|nr:uncharacterized protein Tco025E_04054 [Trypanosoma conorhini]RNF19913.1 hypothetical protein Tco025E_04054 [Trypanosoma conorhini]